MSSNTTPKFNLRTGTWNLLADGLSLGEFLTPTGDPDSVYWGNRLPKIVNCLSKFFELGGHIMSTQENDHPEEILEQLIEISKNKHIKMIKVLKYPTDYQSNALKFHLSKDRVMVDCDGEKKSFRDVYLDTDKLPPQNDSLAVYYNSEFIDFLSESRIEISKKGPTYAGKLQMKTKNNILFQIVVAHLSSGEDSKKAIARESECTSIINSIYHDGMKYGPTIILMDSNSSKLYETKDETLGDGVLEQFKECDYYDILDDAIGLECYKMRHGAGEQPTKFGQFMLDRIDKIMVPNYLLEYSNVWDITNDIGFTTYNNVLNKEVVKSLVSLRTTIEKRLRLKEIVTGSGPPNFIGSWGEKVGLSRQGIALTESQLSEAILPLNSLQHIYPNLNSPSDHPPCFAQINLI